MSDEPEVTIKVRENGPLLVKGRFRLVDHEGRAFDVADDVVLCRCGGSADKPFCDGAHKQGFDGTCARQPR
jgi:CDGSH iron-sulfur domain-containing protein 3